MEVATEAVAPMSKSKPKDYVVLTSLHAVLTHNRLFLLAELCALIGEARSRIFAMMLRVLLICSRIKECVGELGPAYSSNP